MDFVKHAFTCHVDGLWTLFDRHEVRGKVARSTRTVQNFSPTLRAGFVQALWEEHYIFAHTSQYQQ
jgi:hypothetical protein